MWLTLVAVAVLICLFLYKTTKKPANYPPGPVGLPIAGNIFQIDGDFPNKTFKPWWKKYGKIFSLKLGVHDIVVVTDAAEIRKAFFGNDFLDRPKNFLFQAFVYYRNAGISTSWGPNWHEHRRFTMKHLKDYGLGRCRTEEIVKTEVLEVMNLLKENDGKEVEMSWSLLIAITNAIWCITAGNRLDPRSSEMQDFLKMMQDTMLLFGKTGLVDSFPWLEYIVPRRWLPTGEFYAYLDRFYKYFQKEVDHHKLDFNADNEDRDLIDSYLRKFKEEESKPEFDKEKEEFNLLAILGDLFSAGGETTYTTLRWAFLYLIKYPEVQKRIQKDVDDLTAGSRTPCMEDKLKLPYVEAFINEVQRHSDILPLGVPHRSTVDTTILGYNIPKGTQLIPYFTGCLHNPKAWGDPENFRPERFLDSNGHIQKFDDFIPFSIGRRACPGEPLARTQLFLFVTCLLQQFDFESVTGNPDDVSLEAVNEALFRYPKGCNLRIKCRKH